MNCVNYEIDGHVATITLNRPDKGNALNPELMSSLVDILRSVDSDDGVRAIVLRAAGKHFCAGADLDWMCSSVGASAEVNRQDAEHLATAMQALHRVSKPMIALVQGAAIGGGVGVVACADIVLAADTARFGLSETRLGLIPSVIAPYVISKIGAAHSHRYFLSGERITAEQAQRIQLVHDVAPLDELEVRLVVLLESILAGGPAALRAAKAMVRQFCPAPSDAAVQQTVQAIADIRVTPEAQEGMAAFFEKRAPAWIKGS